MQLTVPPAQRPASECAGRAKKNRRDDVGGGGGEETDEGCGSWKSCANVEEDDGLWNVDATVKGWEGICHLKKT